MNEHEPKSEPPEPNEEASSSDTDAKDKPKVRGKRLSTNVRGGSGIEGMTNTCSWSCRITQ